MIHEHTPKTQLPPELIQIFIDTLINTTLLPHQKERELTKILHNAYALGRLDQEAKQWTNKHTHNSTE